MLFGQLVAVSVATNLQYSFWGCYCTAGEGEDIGGATCRCELGALGTVDKRAPSLVIVSLVSHSLQHNYFLANLLVMHALLILPLLPQQGPASCV